MTLQGKAIVVTGSSMGIGEAIARRAAREGARVFVHGVEEGATRAVAGELGAPCYVGDLSDPAHCEELVARAAAELGGIHGLVNNAGVVWRNLIGGTDAGFWDSVMNINARAPMLLIRAALPHLAAARGHVVNIGSVNAYSGEPNLVAYSAAKGALMTLTRNLGDTLHREHGVKVNLLNPGWVSSEGEKQRKIDEGMAEDWFETLGGEVAPAGRILSPDEIAATAVHFLTDDLGPVSGQVIELEQFPLIGRNAPKC